MTIRTHSLEAAASALSMCAGPALLVETANEGGLQRYRVMDPLGDGIVAELIHRDAAIVSFPSNEALQDALRALEASFEDQEGTCFATRLSSFENGAATDVLVLGRELFHEF